MKRSTIDMALLLSLWIAGQAAGAQEIGRLFTTPEERAVLESRRHARPALAGQMPQLAPSTPLEPAYIPLEGEQILIVNGIVRRSGSGHETTWIDSVPHTGPARLAGGASLARDGHAGQVALTLRSGKRVIVKPGQRVDASNGRVSEAYQPPTALARPAPEPAR